MQGVGGEAKADGIARIGQRRACGQQGGDFGAAGGQADAVARTKVAQRGDGARKRACRIKVQGFGAQA